MLDSSHHRSNQFNDIIARCLVKIPSGRSSANSLLEHPFIAAVTDNKPLRVLYQVGWSLALCHLPGTCLTCKSVCLTCT